MEKLQKQLEQIIKNSGEEVSILIKKLNKNEYIYNYNTKIKMISASIIKVPIMLAVLEEVNNKKISLNDKILVENEDILEDTEVFENGENHYTLEELINWMIIESDNTATNVIIKKFGMQNVNNYFTNVLKLQHTNLQRYMLDENAIKNGFNNYTSQEDMLIVFEKLFNKQVLNEELCNKAIEILYNQRCQNLVMRHIYQPVKYAHKTGILDYINHDVGVMNINNKLYYIGISIYNAKNIEGNKALIGNLGRIIFDYLSEIK